MVHILSAGCEEHLSLSAKGREEHLFVHEGPLRATKNTSLYPRRFAKNSFLSTKGHEEHLLLIREGSRRAAVSPVGGLVCYWRNWME